MKIGCFRINAPVTMAFASLCAIITGANYLTNDLVNTFFGTATLPGIVLHIFAHADWDHLLSNMMMFFLLAPMIEEKYGSKTFTSMITATAICSGLILHFLLPHTSALGASGVVFMLICLSSFTGKDDGFPITALFVVVCYLGREFGAMLFSVDNVSQLGHINGGILGAIIGVWGSRKTKESSDDVQ